MSFSAALRFGSLALFVASPSLISPLPAPAQQPGTAVHGTVADPSGAVIPGATVTLTPASGKAIIGTTQGDGTYSLPSVPPGIYSETVTMPGFASFVKPSLRVLPGQPLTADAKLTIQEQS